jgi:hypothetical protein
MRPFSADLMRTHQLSSRSNWWRRRRIAVAEIWLSLMTKNRNPTSPYFVQTIREHWERTGVSSGPSGRSGRRCDGTRVTGTAQEVPAAMCPNVSHVTGSKEEVLRACIRAPPGGPLLAMGSTRPALVHCAGTRADTAAGCRSLKLRKA